MAHLNFHNACDPIRLLGIGTLWRVLMMGDTCANLPHLCRTRQELVQQPSELIATRILPTTVQRK
eukprot:3458217-Amphidinium_carterae.1